MNNPTKIPREYWHLFGIKSSSADKRIKELERQLAAIEGGSWKSIADRMNAFYCDGEYNRDRYKVEERATAAKSQIQPCMVTSCRLGMNYFNGTRKVVTDQNSGLELWINAATIHMAKEHHLLQARQIREGEEYYTNPWGIDVRGFYEYFMD